MNCSSERLLSLVRNGEVDFDADIAGPGVLAAFLATSLIAIITLAVAFVTLSVPSRLLNTGDTVIYAGIRHLYNGMRSKFPKCKRTKVVGGRRERTDAFMAFMVSISDQIMVTQVAILVATLIIHAEITIYSVNIVIALGSLASTVHLGSLPFYVDRLQDHSISKLIRVIAMVAGSVMLVFLLIIQLSSTWDMHTYVYFICAIGDYQITSADAGRVVVQVFTPIIILYGTYKTVRFVYKSATPDEKRLPQGSSLINHEQLVADGERELGDRMREGQENQHTGQPDTEGRKLENEVLAIYEILNLIDEAEIQPIADYQVAHNRLNSRLFKHNPARMSLKEIWRETHESKRDALLNSWLRLKALSLLTSDIKSKFWLKLRVGCIAEQWAFHQCRGSFVWRLLWLWSGNIYGIVAIFTSRIQTTGISGDRDKMGFGQLVPLALLVLPLLAAMESNADYKRKLNLIMNNPEEPPSPLPMQVANVRVPSTCQLFPHNRHETFSPRELSLICAIEERLRERADHMGYPYLYNWARGVELDGHSSLWMGAGCHAGLMFVITTLFGWSMASKADWVTLVLMLIILLFFVRRIVGLVKITKDRNSGPIIVNHLQARGSQEPVQIGNQGERMIVTQAAGGEGHHLQQDDG